MAVFLLIVVLAFLTFQYVGVTSIGFNMDFQTIRQGLWGRKEGGYYVIQNAKDWAEICREVFPPDIVPPEINFSNTTVIAVFMGERPTAGYGIEIREVKDAIFRVVVKVAWITYTGKLVLQVFTAPYHIVKVQKISKPIVFQTIWETKDC